MRLCISFKPASTLLMAGLAEVEGRVLRCAIWASTTEENGLSVAQEAAKADIAVFSGHGVLHCASHGTSRGAYLCVDACW